MDSVGWRANRRADKNSSYHDTPQRGPDGRYEPVEQVYPVSDEVMGGAHVQMPTFPVPQLVPPPGPDSVPPTPPEKDGMQNGSYFPGHTNGQTQQSRNISTSTGRSITQLSAVERSKYLRAVRMNPYLQLMVGPLLRYDTVDEFGVWHGACLIVSADSASVYEPLPTLKYEWDPAPGASDFGRTSSQTGKGTSFELGPHPADPRSFVAVADQNRMPALNQLSISAHVETVPGQEIWVYEDPRGRTFTFWRFMISVLLSQNEMLVRYAVNNGQTLSFFVPGRNQNMRWSAYSCNGFSAGVNSDDFRGPGFDSGYDPVWIDLLKQHERKPFHALVGGGDQIYCDGLTREPELQEWLRLAKPEQKLNHRLSTEMATAIDRFYFNHYCRIFQSGAFARATASIPMVNMADDHDLIDGFGSYPDDLQRSQVFNTIGARGYFFFLLFQCFINVEVDGLDDRPNGHPFKSLILGQQGPYIPYPSHSFLSYFGPNCSILMLDCRAERRKDQVCSPFEYNKVFDKLFRLPPQVQHLIVQIGIPIAYPRMNFMETILGSNLNPLVVMGKRGSSKLGGFVNKFNAEAELLDDLNDHWTAKGHKAERNTFILKLQDFAQRTRTRITFLSGDVHCAAVGLFETHYKDKKTNKIPAEKDHRYMLNIITSAIVNTPPPNAVISLVTHRASKVHTTLHHAQTDEVMVPIFTRDTDGSSGNSKAFMGRRNYCIIEHILDNGGLRFDIRVEKEKGNGVTVGYPIITPAPRWID